MALVHVSLTDASHRTSNALNRRIAIVSGDMHALAWDNGTNSPGGLRVMQTGALDQNSNSKGGPYTTGPIKVPATGYVSHYGLIDVSDDAGSGDVGVRFRGLSVDRATGVDTVQIDVSFALGANP